jgi:hypothetical protein
MALTITVCRSQAEGELAVEARQRQYGLLDGELVCDAFARPWKASEYSSPSHKAIRTLTSYNLHVPAHSAGGAGCKVQCMHIPTVTAASGPLLLQSGTQATPKIA